MALSSPARAHDEFAAAFNAGDLDAVCDAYEADAVFIPAPGEEPLRGLAAIREGYAGFLAMKPKMEIETLYVHENGELALLRARWTITFAGPDGQPVETKGSSVELIRRQPDGTWRQVIDDPNGAG